MSPSSEVVEVATSSDEPSFLEVRLSSSVHWSWHAKTEMAIRWWLCKSWYEIRRTVAWHDVHGPDGPTMDPRWTHQNQNQNQNHQVINPESSKRTGSSWPRMNIQQQDLHAHDLWLAAWEHAYIIDSFARWIIFYILFRILVDQTLQQLTRVSGISRLSDQRIRFTRNARWLWSSLIIFQSVAWLPFL